MTANHFIEVSFCARFIHNQPFKSISLQYGEQNKKFGAYIAHIVYAVKINMAADLHFLLKFVFRIDRLNGWTV